jgi:hypothetical protein
MPTTGLPNHRRSWILALTEPWPFKAKRGHCWLGRTERSVPLASGTFPTSAQKLPWRREPQGPFRNGDRRAVVTHMRTRVSDGLLRHAGVPQVVRRQDGVIPRHRMTPSSSQLFVFFDANAGVFETLLGADNAFKHSCFIDGICLATSRRAVSVPSRFGSRPNTSTPEVARGSAYWAYDRHAAHVHVYGKNPD